jgi:hypothetical protein
MAGGFGALLAEDRPSFEEVDNSYKFCSWLHIMRVAGGSPMPLRANRHVPVTTPTFLSTTKNFIELSCQTFAGDGTAPPLWRRDAPSAGPRRTGRCRLAWAAMAMRKSFGRHCRKNRFPSWSKKFTSFT